HLPGTWVKAWQTRGSGGKAPAGSRKQMQPVRRRNGPYALAQGRCCRTGKAHDDLAAAHRWGAVDVTFRADPLDGRDGKIKRKPGGARRRPIELEVIRAHADDGPLRRDGAAKRKRRRLGRAHLDEVHRRGADEGGDEGRGWFFVN